jgi:hypothetical protein
MANTLNVRKQVSVVNLFILNGKLSGSLDLMSEWTAGNTDNVMKNTKNTLNNCGKACLKIFQYGGLALTSIPAFLFFSVSFSASISW